MPASRIFRLALTSRCAMVGSGTRKAWAISAVDSPPSVRRVRATLASSDSAGWQQVKISRSRSSPMVCISGSCPRVASSWARAARRSASPRSRRSRSIALLRAVVVIHAPGRSGTPVDGQRSMATRKASCTASSARPKSPRIRMRVATVCPDSSRNTRSTISRVVSATLTSQGRSGGRGELHHRADLDRAVARPRDPGRDLDRLVEVLAVDQVVAAELLLGLGEGPVGGERLAAADLHGGRGAGRLERLAALHQAAVDDVLGELVVGLVLGRALGLGEAGLLVAVDQQRVFHASSLLARRRESPPPSPRRTGGAWIDTHPALSSALAVVHVLRVPFR